MSSRGWQVCGETDEFTCQLEPGGGAEFATCQFGPCTQEDPRVDGRSRLADEAAWLISSNCETHQPDTKQNRGPGLWDEKWVFDAVEDSQ